MALALAVLLSRPPTVPPSVEPRQDRQSREHDDEGAAGVALRLLVQDLEQHLLTAPDEPSDPSEDAAPHQGSQASERDELPQVHAGDPCGDRDQVPHHGDHSPHERADLAVVREVALGPVQALVVTSTYLPSRTKKARPSQRASP